MSNACFAWILEAFERVPRIATQFVEYHAVYVSGDVLQDVDENPVSSTCVSVLLDIFFSRMTTMMDGGWLRSVRSQSRRIHDAVSGHCWQSAWFQSCVGGMALFIFGAI